DQSSNRPGGGDPGLDRREVRRVTGRWRRGPMERDLAPPARAHLETVTVRARTIAARGGWKRSKAMTDSSTSTDATRCGPGRLARTLAPPARVEFLCVDLPEGPAAYCVPLPTIVAANDDYLL